MAVGWSRCILFCTVHSGRAFTQTQQRQQRYQRLQKHQKHHDSREKEQCILAPPTSRAISGCRWVSHRTHPLQGGNEASRGSMGVFSTRHGLQLAALWQRQTWQQLTVHLPPSTSRRGHKQPAQSNF